MVEFCDDLAVHLLDETATGVIARFCGSLAVPAHKWCAILLAEVQSASSSPLQGAFAHACANRSAGGQHADRIPCFTLARKPQKRTLMSPLGTVSLADTPVQLRILG